MLRVSKSTAVAALVYLDNAPRTPLLSYLVPEGMTVKPGDAVEVPYGTRVLHGMVLELLDSAGKATRPILQVYGARAHAPEVFLASSVAKHHFVTADKVARRLAPSVGKGASPLKSGPVKLRTRARSLLPDRSTGRQVLVPSPLVDVPLLAAQEAARLSEHGQVLVLCPTVEAVEKVMSQFHSGAVRLDARAARGGWVACRTGEAHIGVGTRAAALYSAAKLGGIIVLDDTHPGHEEVSQPYTHARDLASARSRAVGAKLTIISAFPSPQALAATTAAYPVGAWPRIRIADRIVEGHLTPHVGPAMQSAIAVARRSRRGVVVLASNKESVVRCKGCGSVREDSSRGCNCSVCGSDKVRTSGWSVARLKSFFKDSAQVTTLAKAETQSSTTVIVYDIDGLLHTPELYPDTLASSYLWQAAALTGGSGELVVGTTNPKDPLLRDLASGKGLLPAARRALARAQDAQLPPFGRLVRVVFERKTPPDVSNWPGLVSSPLKVGEGRWEVLVRIPIDQLLELQEYVDKARKNSKARVRVS